MYAGLNGEDAALADQWTIRGVEYDNCEAVAGGIVEEGHFNDTRLDGLRWIMLIWWPGEIADGNGRQQFNTLHMNQDGIIR